MSRLSAESRPDANVTYLDGAALAYIALPNAIFLASWIVFPLGPLAAVVLLALVSRVVARGGIRRDAPLGALWFGIVAVAGVWCLFGGQGHFLYANSDWWVRDAVLLDLVRDPWPVVFHVNGVDTLLRTPVGFYLPAALGGKLLGIRAAELLLLAWSVLGVSIVFGFMLRDRPPLRAAVIRIVVFVVFSGMDIIPTVIRDYPHQVGAMIEWWPTFMMYGSTTTLLFWAPNHTVPGWVALAWLLAQDPRTVSVRLSVLFVALMPISAPLTALGMAPFAAVAILRRVRGDPQAVKGLFNFAMLIPVALCCALVFPYLVAGSDKIHAGLMWHIPWVGEDYEWRYLDFILFEFIGFAILLVLHDRRDRLLWVSICVLLFLPLFYFGPYNDLVMRSSIPALALLAIRSGRWLSTPSVGSLDVGYRVLLVALLAVGAVTPFMEFARTFVGQRWDMNVHSSLVEVTRGTHYLTPFDQPWLQRFIARPRP